jgi:hypothetical protein
MEAVKADPQEPIPVRNWKPQDWIDHASFGVGRVSEEWLPPVDNQHPLRRMNCIPRGGREFEMLSVVPPENPPSGL